MSHFGSNFKKVVRDKKAEVLYSSAQGGLSQ